MTDPSSEEEELLGGSLSIVVDENKRVCAINKPGGIALAEDKLRECIEQAKSRVSQVQKLIEDGQIKK